MGKEIYMPAQIILNLYNFGKEITPDLKILDLIELATKCLNGKLSVEEAVQIVADKYKIALGQLISGHLGEYDENGQTKVFSSLFIMQPKEVCTASYLSIGIFEKSNECNNATLYLKTKFVRFLVLQTLTSMHITRNSFSFVPLQDFSHPWTDEMLYKKYGLTEDEIAFIESMIRPME